MKIKLLVFAQLKELIGHDHSWINLKKGDLVGEAVDELSNQLPEFARKYIESEHLHFAVNETFVDKNHKLQEGDVLALIPPMSGG